MIILTDGDNRTNSARADNLKGHRFHLIELYLSRFGLRVW
jgi:hypothetical protein